MPRRRNPIARAATAWSPLWLNRAIARPVGRMLACLVPRVRKVTLANLDRAYGSELTPREKSGIYWGAIDNLAMVAAEFSHVNVLARIEGLVTVKGIEHIEEKRGYLCIGAHLGNWELMGPLMATGCKHKVAEVVRPFDDPRVDRAIDAIRTSAGVRTIPKDGAGKEVMAVLKEGYLVGILVDQSPRDNGVPVTFFGSPCWATVAPVMIAVRAKAPILPVALTRNPGGGFVLQFLPPIEIERTGDFRADLVRYSQRCQDAIEALVRETPEQWLWLHRRWKERPRLADEWKHRTSKDG